MSSAVAQQEFREPTAIATRPARAVGGVIPWDPFALMDRLDADLFMQEMQGIATDVLVYRIKDGAKETVGLSKTGVDECCTMLVSQGQVIREESLKYELFGEGESREAVFTVIAARYAVNGDGREVRCDQVIGVKREPLYEERAPLALESRVPGKKWRHLTFAQALADNKARGYLEWIVDGSSFDDATKEFTRRVLAGEDVRDFAMGKRFNPFWFEHGAMKAARNARFRLIPAGIKAQVIALAKQEQRVKEVDRAPADADGVSTDSADQLDDDATNAPLALTLEEANELAFPWKQHSKYGGKPLRDVSTAMVYRVLWWADDRMKSSDAGRAVRRLRNACALIITKRSDADTALAKLVAEGVAPDEVAQAFAKNGTGTSPAAQPDTERDA